MIELSVLIKPVSWNCNLSCRYCFYLDKKNMYPGSVSISKQTFLNFLEKYLPLQRDINICFQGGEPLILDKKHFKFMLDKIVEMKGRNQNLYLTLQTNGTLIDKTWAEIFKDYNILVGVSLDGPERIHNYYRGNSFKMVMKGIDILVSMDVEFNILCTINSYNSLFPVEVYSFFREQNFFYIQFIPILERDGYKIKSFSVSPEKYKYFLSTVFDIWYEDGYPEVYINLFEYILQRFYGLTPPSCFFQRECGRYIVLEYNGDIYPCDFFVDRRWHLMNINFEEISDLENLKGYKIFRRNKIDNLSDGCKICRWLEFCYGGCPHYRFNGVFYFCKGYREFLIHIEERAKKIVEKVKNENNLL